MVTTGKNVVPDCELVATVAALLVRFRLLVVNVELVVFVAGCVHRLAGRGAVILVRWLYYWPELLHSDQLVGKLFLAHVVQDRSEHGLDVVALVKGNDLSRSKLKLHLHLIQMVHVYKRVIFLFFIGLKQVGLDLDFFGLLD